MIQYDYFFLNQNKTKTLVKVMCIDSKIEYPEGHEIEKKIFH